MYNFNNDRDHCCSLLHCAAQGDVDGVKVLVQGLQDPLNLHYATSGLQELNLSHNKFSVFDVAFTLVARPGDSSPVAKKWPTPVGDLGRGWAWAGRAESRFWIALRSEAGMSVLRFLSFLAQIGRAHV